MIAVEVDAGPDWGGAGEWAALAERAVLAAVRASAHDDLLDAASRIEVSIKLTDDEEVRELNAAFRSKDKPTNVLSFPMLEPDLLDGINLDTDGETLLGDVVVARGVCGTEAAEKGIPLDHHLIHLLVHGTLHLLGHDHGDNVEGDRMEEMERAALATLGLPDPYLIGES